MAGTVHMGMKLLLFAFIGTGLNGEDGLILAQRGYDITFPCEEDVICFHIWQLLSTGQAVDYIAIVINEDIQTAGAEEEASKCTLQITGFTAEDVGRHRCQQRPDVFFPHNTPSELNLMSGKKVSLQCVLLTYIEQGLCYTQQQQLVTLMWVDEAGADIQDKSQHQIRQNSGCDITLTVTLQSLENKKFRCQATVGQQVQTSVELSVRALDVKGRGRGLVIDLEPENQGGSQDTVGAAVGLVGCAVLAVLLVAVCVVKKRRTRKQLADKSGYRTSTNNNVVNAEEVIYAELILPDGVDRVGVLECESTEYACVRY